MEERHFGPVWFIPGERGGKYPFCHSLYIEGAGVLIDPASDRERLLGLGRDQGVSSVWLSHWHEDHFMHLDLFDGLPLSVAEADAWPLSDLDRFLDAYGMEGQERIYWKPIIEQQFHFRPRRPARFLRDGEVISFESCTVEIISAPGHTPGHLAFYFKEPAVLFLGDYDLTRFGPWYGDTYSSIEETIASVKRLKEIPAKVRLTGHEQGVFEEDPGILWDRYLGVIREREDKLLDLLKTPRTLEEIVKACIVYGKPREPRIFYEFGERSHMKKHLERLIRQGRVVALDGKYGRCGS